MVYLHFDRRMLIEFVIQHVQFLMQVLGRKDFLLHRLHTEDKFQLHVFENSTPV